MDDQPDPTTAASDPQRPSQLRLTIVGLVAIVLVLLAVGAVFIGGGGSHSHPCVAARHTFESAPSILDGGSPADEADGLPPSGTATESAAVAALEAVPSEYGDVEARTLTVDGRAWRRTAAGAIEVVAEELDVLEVTVPTSADCPIAPQSLSGVPVLFRHEAD